MTVAQPRQRVLSTTQDERRVFRSKAHAVADGMLNLRSSSHVGHVVKIALGIGRFEVDGGRNLAVLHGDQRSCQASGTARALGMSDLRLQSRHWDFLGTITKSQLERSSFHTVVHLGGS